MNIPLNVDWQQILLHWLNLAILVGGLYFLLYKPVKNFMQKREEHYRDLDRQAAYKLKDAQKVKQEYDAMMEDAESDIRERRHKAQMTVQKSAEEQLKEAKTQAEHIISEARAQAELTKDRAMKESQRELKRLAAEAAEKMAFHPGTDPFDQFLNLTEGGQGHESR